MKTIDKIEYLHDHPSKLKKILAGDGLDNWVPICPEWLEQVGFKDEKGIKVWVMGDYDIEQHYQASEFWEVYYKEEEFVCSLKHCQELNYLMKYMENISLIKN
jgi:hypothetical protein